MSILHSIVFVSLLVCVPVVQAYEVPPNDGFVTDTADILSDAQELQLESMLDAYARQTTNVLAIVTVKSLSEPIEDVANLIGREWGVGTAQFDNGIVLLLAYQDRALRIEPGYGLEGAVPDIVAQGIGDNEMLPYFRDGEYFEGFVAGIDALTKHIAGEYSIDRYESGPDFGPLFPYLPYVIFFVFSWLGSILGRTKPWWLGGVIGFVCGVVITFFFALWLSIPILSLLGLLFDYSVSRNYKKRGKTSWWAGGSWGPGGSSGRGSSFSSFSGGSFGGGGATSRW